jgi:exodeoxyribonuclease VII large subunit
MLENENIKTWTITQYNKAAQRKLEGVPAVWVQGVITSLKIKGAMSYWTLAEFDEAEERPKATIDLVMNSRELNRIQERLASQHPPLEISEQMKVALLLQAEFYVPWGRFQPRVLDIDPKFTLGELALTKAKILAKLDAEGLIDRNRRLPWPRPALRIGLITAQHSAAYNDFVNVINHSPYAFRIVPEWATMQGNHCAESVSQAMERLLSKTVDVVCIIRGGGAKTDLVYFDNEMLCRSIAHYPIPVLTGIGHQIDTSLADLVAWRSSITPTECAQFLVDSLDQESALLAQKLEAIQYRTRSIVALHQQRLSHNQQQVKWLVQNQLRRETQKIQAYHSSLLIQTRTRFRAENQRIEQIGEKLRLYRLERLWERGWVLARTQEGFIPNWAALQTGQLLSLQHSSGVIHVRIESIPSSNKKS